MRLPPRLILEHVEDCELGRSEADRKPRDRARLVLDERLPAFENFATSSSFPGFACNGTRSPPLTIGSPFDRGSVRSPVVRLDDLGRADIRRSGIPSSLAQRPTLS